MTTLRAAVSASVLAFANVMAAQTSLAPIPTEGATNFVASTKNQLVNVIQKGPEQRSWDLLQPVREWLDRRNGRQDQLRFWDRPQALARGTPTGVRGNSVPDNGIGVVGSAAGANGIGVWGQTTGSGGLGGYFDNISGGIFWWVPLTGRTCFA